MHSKFIVMEGIDGAGKSLAALKLVEYLNKNHCPTLHTYEPYGSFITQTIYAILYHRIPEPDPRVMATLFTAARMHHIDHVIKPALRDGLNVVSDRYIFSTFSYNTVCAREQEAIEIMHTEFYYPPDHVFYLNCDVEVAIERTIKNKDKQSIFDTDSQRLRTIADQYMTMFAEQETVTVCGQSSLLHIIDANQERGKVMKQILKFIEPLIVKPLTVKPVEST